MQSKFNAEQEKLHNQLLTDINNQLDQSSNEYEAFRMHIKKPLGGAGTLGRCKNLFDIFSQLARRKGQLGILNYNVLKDALIASDNEDIVNDTIKEAEEKIRAAGDRVASTAGPSAGGADSNVVSSSAVRASKTDDGAPIAKVPKINIEDTDPSDGRFFSENGLGYYQTDKKTGYLLILNFEKDRNFTEIDVQSLKQFFHDELGFEVDSPRDVWNDDFTTQEVTDRLEFVRRNLSDNYKAEKYYCFICVILSHGSEGFFYTKDGQFRIEDIRKMFNNRHLPKFAGKPKIFFIQACRGPGEQLPIEVDDEADDEHIKPQVIDESDTIISIPNDADVLMAYATTPGYRAFRRAGKGSWFINECVSVFREFHQRCTLEDMLVTVRERVAVYWEKYNRTKQMPCSWSTLTKRLRLRKSQC